MTENNKNEALILALGFFDGVHLGHQVLLKEVLNMAKKNHCKTAVLTFEEHPLELIFPKYSPWLLTTNEEKSQIIKSLGIDYVFINPFTTELMELSPEEFIVNYLLKRYAIKGIVIGFNYNFGYKGEGTTETLKALGKKYGFAVSIVSSCLIDENTISSSFIRELISCGQVNWVHPFLGRDYSILGKVIRGKGLGHQFNIPTANIKLNKKRILPNAGVYYTKVVVDGVTYNGLTNLGYNPTFEKHPFSIETYIYNFNADIYGKEMTIIFKKKLRNEIKFDCLESLIARIKQDIETIRTNYIEE